MSAKGLTENLPLRRDVIGLDGFDAALVIATAGKTRDVGAGGSD
jgi:hypothetical protein